MNILKETLLKNIYKALNNPGKLFIAILSLITFSVLIDVPTTTRNILIAFYSELSKKPITELSLINRILFICTFFSFVFFLVLLFRIVENWLRPKFHPRDNCLWKWQFFKKSFERIPYCPIHVCKMERLSKEKIREFYDISNKSNREIEMSILYGEDEYQITEDSIIYRCSIKKCSKNFQKFRFEPSDNSNDQYFNDMKYNYLTEIGRVDLLERI